MAHLTPTYWSASQLLAEHERGQMPMNTDQRSDIIGKILIIMIITVGSHLAFMIVNQYICHHPDHDPDKGGAMMTAGLEATSLSTTPLCRNIHRWIL